MSKSVKFFFVNRFRHFRPQRSAPPKIRFITVGPDRNGEYQEVFDLPMVNRRGKTDRYQYDFRVMRTYGKPIRPVFVSLDSVDMDSHICTNYIADTNEMWASMQENDYPEWSTCKNCHEHIDDC